MKRIYIILMLLLSGVMTYATDVKTLAEEATKMYQEGDYQKAIDLYNEMLSDDMESATVYYNLGNCYYKQGEIAKAILNYERALLLHPGDNDIKYNLTMAQKATVDNIKVLPELFLVRWYNAFVTAFTADQWAYVCYSIYRISDHGSVVLSCNINIFKEKLVHFRDNHAVGVRDDHFLCFETISPDDRQG